MRDTTKQKSQQVYFKTMIEIEPEKSSLHAFLLVFPRNANLIQHKYEQNPHQKLHPSKKNVHHVLKTQVAHNISTWYSFAVRSKWHHLLYQTLIDNKYDITQVNTNENMAYSGIVSITLSITTRTISSLKEYKHKKGRENKVSN
jgi:hypothetical protein